MGKQIAVIGLGRFGTSLAKALYEAGNDVLAVDKVSDLVENISSSVTQAVRINVTSEAAIQKLGIGKYDIAVVAIGASIQDSVMITILLKHLGVKYVVARAESELHGSILEKIGADKIIFPERDTAFRTAPILTMREVTDFIPLNNGSGIVKAKVTPYLIGKTLEDIGLGSETKSKAAVLMIQRGKEGIICPGPKEVVSHIDILIIAGNNNDIESIFEKAAKAGKAEADKKEKE